MRSPENVLNSLNQKSKDTKYHYHRLYRNLYNPNFYYLAYQNIYAKEGNMTVGTDGTTIDGMSITRITKLIEQIKVESYKPKAVRRVYIPKQNGKKRPLGIPSVDDKLVQEVIRMLLNAIYDSNFSTHSHGFRPKRSCHTALKEIKTHFDGTRWFVEGDIESYFDSIDHHTLINILRKRIQDERFLNLIWKFLRAGYLEDWKYHKTYSGTPQGGIISPILANIYLDEFDKYMEKLKENLYKGERRTLNPPYSRLASRITRLKRKLKNNKLTSQEKQEIHMEISETRELRSQTSMTIPNDENFKRLFYVRYADDFIIGIIGSKEEAKGIKAQIADYLSTELKLNLSDDKTLITHSSKKARFLGYDITIARSQSRKMCKDGKMRRTASYKCMLYVPKEKWVNNLKDKGILKILHNGNWKQTHRRNLVDLDDLEILNIYNSEIRGLYNYYQLANNVSVLNKYYYHMKYSMYKTFANKYKSTINKITNKYCENGVFMVRYKTRTGEKERHFYNQGFQRKIVSYRKDNSTQQIDIIPNEYKNCGITSLIDRLTAEKCEYCERENIPLEMHHVRKLKDLKGKRKWEIEMIGRKRKTLALCHECHVKLHSGKLD
ncbi:hypothetical protein IIU_00434 [Bacillus cereus VD133]|uniref:Reverse transcriptase domain-containing protein n=1 Tax=Bacillus cereus VD133 TaxID=1053233 RepID=A0A9W5PWX3_BACCE|nr:reverse transcriptase/maturase family protein [Bacillus cereus]EOO24104.1 hypothetical protein IIU_06832 [Bacillus cereus VD133]EOO25437.1 hypothetical protein IIU_06178 [Bacillus cereus VD133]EOO26186.1 hypothetical protein IIU_06028 [Bacillus cereus VD133]EOO29735.1 hypothetical protein IIU_05320 [Bacillus cereus VD133]EOO32259.1 hypothetical protein IIU_04297 [Bacillus cereus VD133]